MHTHMYVRVICKINALCCLLDSLGCQLGNNSTHTHTHTNTYMSVDTQYTEMYAKCRALTWLQRAHDGTNMNGLACLYTQVMCV
jgi:hypothetical protein